jgi:hypothetical protein
MVNDPHNTRQRVWGKVADVVESETAINIEVVGESAMTV